MIDYGLNEQGAQLLWDETVSAFRSARTTRRYARANALLEVYCMLTGLDDEAMHEAVQDELVAEHERSLAETVDY